MIEKYIKSHTFHKVWILKTKRHSTRQRARETFYRVCLCTHYKSHISVKGTGCINHTVCND